MAFATSERVQIKRWLGSPGIFYNSNPYVDVAISAAQAQTDPGGTMPDNSTELAIRGWLANLATLEAQMNSLQTQMQVGTADEATLDAPRGLLGLRMLARMYIGHISDALDTKPYRDVFAAKQTCM